MIKVVQIRTTHLDGATEITAPKWDGRAFRMSHRTFSELDLATRLFGQVGVYILFPDHYDRSRHGNKLYVGQTGTPGQRPNQQVVTEEFRSAVLLFSTKNDWMNKAYTFNIERQFVRWAKDAGRYEVINGNNGREEHLDLEDQKRLSDFLAGVRPVLQLAGVDVFERNLDDTYVAKDNASVVDPLIWTEIGGS
jgi:hypothetical protein